MCADVWYVDMYQTIIIEKVMAELTKSEKKQFRELLKKEFFGDMPSGKMRCVNCSTDNLTMKSAMSLIAQCY